MAPENRAAWLHAAKQPLQVGPAEMPKAGPNEVVIRNRAIAINPVSGKIHLDTAHVGLVKQWPLILDYDVAGEIHEVGADVKGFRVGDRVVAFVWGTMSANTLHGAFQLYSLAQLPTLAHIPNEITFAQACVLPVAFQTAIVALCGAEGEKGFGLPEPSLPPSPAQASGPVIVIWAASSAVGLQALQVAAASGVRVVATASPRNFDLCRSCGATAVIDHASPTAADEVVDAVRATGGKIVGVLDCLSVPGKSIERCWQVLERLGGGILNVLDPGLKLAGTDTIRVVKVIGLSELTHGFWKDYVTSALRQGVLKCLPEPRIVGDGLEHLQEGLEIVEKGVSASKVVVTLESS